MQKIIFYVVVSLCFFVSKITAQETFEERARVIAFNIERISKEEKQLLKEKVEEVNKQLESGKITQETADKEKMDLATFHAKQIEEKVALEQEKLNALVQEKLDGKVYSERGGTSIVIGGNNDSISENKREVRFPSMKVYKGNKEKQERLSKRTTSQFVFAAGVNNLVTNESIAHSDFRFWGSHFYELGLTYNTRLMKNNNLLHAKYGLSVMYNNLRPTENRYFVESDNQTVLATSGIHLKDSRFRNVSLVVPLHLEFDFTPKKVSKDGTKTYFNTHDSFRLGIGGFAGANIKSKQILEYEENGHDYTLKEKGDFNTNDFVYGVSSYIGYGQTSLYVKYDLNPLFKDNPIKQNNISFGVRFDLN